MKKTLEKRLTESDSVLTCSRERRRERASALSIRLETPEQDRQSSLRLLGSADARDDGSASCLASRGRKKDRR